VVVLSGSNATLGCIPTDSTLEIRWVYYDEDGTATLLSPTNNDYDDDDDDDDDDNDNDDDDQIRQTVQPAIVFDPPGLYHQITMIDVTIMNTGTYSCEVVPSCNDPLPVTYNVTVIVVPGIVPYSRKFFIFKKFINTVVMHFQK